MKQQSFFKPGKFRKQHGGALSIRKRRSRRPLSCNEPLHVTLRSDFAVGPRSLVRHRPRIERVLKKAAERFGIRIYEKAICGNHIHLLVRGKRRISLQNFFRVVAGHITQGILAEFPIQNSARQSRGGAPNGRKLAQDLNSLGHPKNQRKFWALLLYSRILTWGREFKSVQRYIVQNILEALYLIAYRPRIRRRMSIQPSICG